MTRTIPSDWQVRRSHINHQWLKNRLLSAMDSVANLFSGRLRGDGMVEDLFRHELAEWEERMPECKLLLDEFEFEMSPRILFQVMPLSDWEEPLKDTVGQLVHELWLARYPIRNLIDEATSKLEAANLSYQELKSQREQGGYGGGSNELRQSFDTFREACRSLSRAIEKLPNRILVV